MNEFDEAKARGEARAAEALAIGAATTELEPDTKTKVGYVRPEMWERCDVCGAPAIDPTTGRCEMAVCETRTTP